MREVLLAVLVQHGYWLLLVGVMLESAGVPLPGETLLLAGGFLASQGYLNLGGIIVVAALGAMAGDNLGYWVGRRWMRPALQQRGRFFWLTPPRLEGIERFFQRHGTKTVLWARFVTGLRVVAALFAGLSGMPWRAFVLYNVAGAALWASAVGLLGFFFGSSWTALERWLGRGSLVTLAAGTLLVLIWVVRRHLPRWQRAWPGWLTLREAAWASLTLVALGLFAKITEDVVTQEAVVFDPPVLRWLHQHLPAWLEALMGGITQLGSAGALILLVGLASAWLWCRRRRREVWLLVGGFGLSEGLNLLLKWVIGRDRPALWGLWSSPADPSFPSGHTMESTLVYGLIAYVLSRDLPQRWRRRGIGLGAGLIVVAIGVSRLSLGVHWPTDVLAGWALGAAGVFLGIYLAERPAGGDRRGLQSSPARPRASGAGSSK